MTRSFYSPNDSWRAPFSPFFPHWAVFSPGLCRHHPGTPSKVKSELPEERVGGVFSNRCEPCPGSAVMKVGEPEILLNNIANLRDSLVSSHFGGGEIGALDRLSHDSIGNAVHGKERPVWFSEVPLVGIDLFDGVVRVATASDTKREIGTVVMGGRSEFRGKKKPVAGIDGGMLLQSEEGDPVLDRPVRFNIPRKFKGVTVLVPCALPLFLISSSRFSVLRGRLAD